MTCWLFHKWTKWQQYVQTGLDHGIYLCPRPEGIPYSERRQRRHCEICGKEQDILVER
jgi:hypothetical protein